VLAKLAQCEKTMSMASCAQIQQTEGRDKHDQIGAAHAMMTMMLERNIPRFNCENRVGDRWEQSTWCREATHLVGRLHARPQLDEPLDCILVPIVGGPVECGRLQHLRVVVVDICSIRDEAAGDKRGALDQGESHPENGKRPARLVWGQVVELNAATYPATLSVSPFLAASHRAKLRSACSAFDIESLGGGEEGGVGPILSATDEILLLQAESARPWGLGKPSKRER
jgi:hypothetical protein